METCEPVCITFETKHEIGNVVGHKIEKSVEGDAEERVACTGDEKFPEKCCLLFANLC